MFEDVTVSEVVLAVVCLISLIYQIVFIAIDVKNDKKKKDLNL